jgi:predicted phosphodiesterase
LSASKPCLTCLWEDETGTDVDRSKSSGKWAKEVGASEASIRRHWAHGEREVEYPTFDLPSYGGASTTALATKWNPIHQADPVIVNVPLRSPQPPRNASLAIKGGDTQVGFRRFVDGRTEAFHDDKAIRLFIQVCAYYQPDYIDLLGDLLDLPSQGKYVKEAAFANTTQLALNYMHSILAQLRAVCTNAEIRIVEGNHDKRMQNFIEINTAETFGIKRANLPDELPVMAIPYLLRLDELDIEYVDAYPTATTWDNSTTRNLHGTRANSQGSTTSQYVKELPHINTWAGHTHRTEITYKTVMGAYGEAIESYSANPGCLCRTDGAVPSVKGAIHSDGTSARVVEDWQQGFGMNYFTETESWPSVYRIRDGRTMIGDKEFSVE